MSNPEERSISPQKMDELVSLVKRYESLERMIKELKKKQQKIKAKILEL